MKTAKKILVVALSVFLWLIILLAALFAFTTLATRDDTKVASVLGYTPMVVQSPSMEPVFYQGDLIIIKKCDTSKLKVDDIVTFHHYGYTATHGTINACKFSGLHISSP